MKTMIEECERLQLEWGNWMKLVVEWKLYHLHRTARMAKGGGGTVGPGECAIRGIDFES